MLRTRSPKALDEIRLAPPVPLPGAPPPTDEEPGPFIAHILRWRRGLDAAIAWRDAPPMRAYASDPGPEVANWVLEVGQISLMRLSDGALQVEIQSKLFETASGRLLAKGSSHGRAEPEAVRADESEAMRLERQYRARVRTLCVEMLAEMKMIGPDSSR